jgi:low temperature requirement protein LtrA
MTQVTGYMVHAHDALGVLEGLLILALMWWTWCAYAWLGNQARADTGVVRAAMAVAMAALFVVALTIPEAWHDAEGGLYGPLVLVVAYLIVRCVHLTVYVVAARGDPGLRRQLAISWVPTLAGAVLLIAGVLLGGQLQIVFFAGALVVDWGGIYLTEHRVRETQGQARARMAIEAYTYGHFPIVAGIIVGAVGVEGVLAHAGDGKPLGFFYAATLYGGFALYLAGHLLFKHRVYAELSVPRLVMVVVLLLALPAAAFLPPLVGLAGLVLLLVVLIGLETRRYASLRAGFRLG